MEKPRIDKKLKLTRKINVSTAATLSKAVSSQNSVNEERRSLFNNININEVTAISDYEKKQVTDNENILDLFPDIELAKQIIVSSIVSPDDLQEPKIKIDQLKKILPESIQSEIASLIFETINGEYNILDNISSVVEKTVFTYGAFISMVLPESILDGIINSDIYGTTGGLSSENVKSISSSIFIKKSDISASETLYCKNIGNLGNADGGNIEITESLALENYFNHNSNVGYNPHLTIIKKDGSRKVFEEAKVLIEDNYDILKLPLLKEKISREHYKTTVFKKVFEKATLGEKPTLSSENVSFRKQDVQSEPIAIIPPSSSQPRLSVTRPLRLTIPMESVVPIIESGRPDNHLGYLLLVDEFGGWIDHSRSERSNRSLSAAFNNQPSNNAFMSSLTDRAHRNLKEKAPLGLTNAIEIYSSIIVDDILSRIKNGRYGINGDVKLSEDWVKIMLSRTLANKFTRIVFVPKEYITYYAIDYKVNGVGKSYMSKIHLISGLRSIVLFGRIMNFAKNAIGNTNVKLAFDPNDPDPEKTIEIAMHDIQRLRSNYLPNGLYTSGDAIDWITRAGFTFSFGEHPNLPNTKIEFESSSFKNEIPDTEFEEELRKQTFLTFGITPEQIDESFSNFAAEVFNKNKLFTQRISVLSNKISKHLTNDCKNILRNDPIFIKQLIDELIKNDNSRLLKYNDDLKKMGNEEAIISELVQRVIENTTVSLYKPAIDMFTTNMEAYEERINAIKNLVDNELSEEVLSSEINGEVSSHLPIIKAIIIRKLLKDWRIKNNYLTEYDELYEKDDENNPTFDLLENIIEDNEALMQVVSKYVSKIKEASNESDQELKDAGIGGDNDMQTSDDSSSSSLDEGDGDMGMSDMSDMDNFEDEDNTDEGKETDGAITDKKDEDVKETTPKEDTEETVDEETNKEKEKDDADNKKEVDKKENKENT